MHGSLAQALALVEADEPPLFWTNTNISIIIVGLVLGMKYLHSRNIIHRDLKPGNLLLDEKHRIRICDFGISKIQSCGTTRTDVAFTIAYVAPEVLFGGTATTKADVFSFGLIIYEMLVGKSAFPRTSTIVDMNAVHHNGVRPEIPSHVGTWITGLIEACWSVDPDDRPTFREIYLRLEEIGFALFEDVDSQAVRMFISDVEDFEYQGINP
jgi:serine/threonine protein kinase